MHDLVYTIGHSNRSIRDFLVLLTHYKITAVADVRSQPYSRANPQFNRAALPEHLKSHQIEYVFLGRELGGRSADPSCWKGNRVDYARIAETEGFKRGLERVENGARKYRIALMCAEREPLACHRTILVARHLARRGFYARHIIDLNSVEEHEATLERLLEILRIQGNDMFVTREQMIDSAYDIQGSRIAFERVEPPTTRRMSA